MTDSSFDQARKSLLEDLLWFETLDLPLFACPQLVQLNSSSRLRGFLLRETEFSIDIQSLSLEIKHHVKFPQGTGWIEKSQVDTQLALKDSLWASLPEEIQRQILERSATYDNMPCLSLVCKAWFLCIHRAEDFAPNFARKLSYSVCDVRSTIEAALVENEEKDFLSRNKEESHVLAWLAYKHGMMDEATKLMQKPKVSIKTMMPIRLLWIIVLRIGKLDEPFEKLLAELKFLEPFYPRTDRHYPELCEYITVLEAMMVEGKEHDERMNGKIFAELSEDEQIEELIYQLRTQNGHQWCQPGACDLLSDGRDDNPLKQLIQRGYAAIPKLIPHLEDSTLTRSVGYHRNFYFSHHVLRVGDCCLRAVTAITKKSFYERTTTNSYASSENQLTSIKAQVEQWWSDFGAKGKKQMSIDQIMEFKHNDAETAMKEFVKEFPEDVLAIYRTVFDGRECPVSNELFKILAQVQPQSPEIVALLSKEFAFRPSMQKALVCLRVKDFDLAPVNAFVLKTYPLCLSTTARRDDFEGVVDYIARADLKEGARLMAETVPNMSDSYLIHKVCRAIVEGKPVSWGSPWKKQTYPKECFDVIYACLRKTTRDGNTAELRLCDEVANIVSARNKKYRFYPLTSEENRDRQIEKILFNLRQENGSAEEMDVPMNEQPRNSDEIPLTQVYSLLCKYVEAKRHGDERSLAFESDIKGYGFKIIPTIDKFIAQSQSNEEKEVMKALAREIAFKIQSVTFVGTTATLDALLAPLRHMQHFDYQVVSQVASSVALAKIAGTSVYIQYARFKDQLGVNLRVEVGENKTENRVTKMLVYNGDQRKSTEIYSRNASEQLEEYITILAGFNHNTPFVGYFMIRSAL